MDNLHHHQSVPPPFNRQYQSAPLHQLQRQQPLQHPLAAFPPTYEPLSANHHNHSYIHPSQQQQRFLHPLTSVPPQQPAASFVNHSIRQFVPVPSQPQLLSYPLVHQHGFTGNSVLPQLADSAQHQRPVEDQLLVEHHRQSEANSQNEHPPKPDTHLEGLKLVADPPDLQVWREKLFGVDDNMIVLSEEQFQVYFPHVDNIYSHRSTQKYKRRPFISHYWDCRLKGRPAGTPKSDDPTKKKRKRVARERDLCDVKIKITEYLPGATKEDISMHLSQQPRSDGVSAESVFATVQEAVGKSNGWQSSMAALGGEITETKVRFYTIQRVNGTGPKGKDEGTGGHRHSLEESDRIKKNSVVRWMMKNDRSDRVIKPKKVQEKKSYHTKATGAALATVRKHSKDNSLKLYGGCFCPFVQRVWISLEIKQIPYQYIEVDPYKKPDSLMKINPRGLIPALQHGDWGCYESSVLMEYLEDLGFGQSLLGSDPKARANSRLWSDHVNKNIVPGYYRYLQAQEADKQAEYAVDFKNQIMKLVDAADPTGPFFLGSDISFVDVQFAPWLLRLSRVLKPYRAWPDPEPGTRWAKWVDAIEGNEAVKSTTSTDDLYLDSYERYAENRPNTSQVANAINEGRGLP